MYTGRYTRLYYFTRSTARQFKSNYSASTPPEHVINITYYSLAVLDWEWSFRRRIMRIPFGRNNWHFNEKPQALLQPCKRWTGDGAEEQVRLAKNLFGVTIWINRARGIIYRFVVMTHMCRTNVASEMRLSPLLYLRFISIR